MNDKLCMSHVTTSIHRAIPWYLMASHAYYKDDDPIITDETYDKLARMIDKFWDKIEHRHKSYINRDDLKAGTFLGEYPSMVEGAVEELRRRTK